MPYLSLLIFCMSTSITPGPNNMLMLLSGVKYGVKPSLPHFWGICVGFVLMVDIVGIGLGEVFAHYPVIHTVMKYVGAIYMLYLSYKTIFASDHLTIAKDNRSKPFTMLQGVLFQWVNPKAWIMAIGVISTFTVVNKSIWFQLIPISIIYFIAMIPSVLFWLIGGATLRKYLDNPRHLRIFNWTMGVLLAFSIITIFFE